MAATSLPLLLLLLLPLLLVSDLCISPLPVSARCLENTSADGCTTQGPASGTEIKAFSPLLSRELSDVTALSAEVPAANQHSTRERARLRRSGRRRWVAASPVRFRNLNSQSKDGTGLIENQTRRNITRDVAAKTLPPHYSSKESEQATESDLALQQTDRPEEKSTVTLLNADPTFSAIPSRNAEARATSIHALSTESTTMSGEATSLRSLEVNGERSVSSKQEMVSHSGEDSETTESHFTVKQSYPSAIHLQSTSENNSLPSDERRLLTNITVGTAVPSATTLSIDSSALHNNDNTQSSHVVSQATLQQIRELPGSEEQQSYSTERINLKHSIPGDSSPIELPDTEERVQEVVTRPIGWPNAGDTNEQETSLGSPLALSRLPSKRLWKTTDFDHQTIATVTTTEFPAIESTSVADIQDHATTNDILNSSQMMPPSSLKHLQETYDSQKSVSDKSASEYVDRMQVLPPDESISSRQWSDSNSESQKAPNITHPLQQFELPSNHLGESTNVSLQMPQETVDSGASMSASTSDRHEFVDSVESSISIPKATLRQLNGPPNNESESYIPPERESINTRKEEISTPKEFWKKSDVRGAEEIPSRNWSYAITNGRNSQETSSIEPPPVGLSRLPSKRLWKLVTGQQQTQAIASDIHLPASTMTTTVEAPGHPDVPYASDSNHIIPKATVKQLHGPPESETQWHHPPKNTEEQMKANVNPTEKGVSSENLLDFGHLQESSTMGPVVGVARLPSKRLWIAVNDTQPMKTKDWTKEPLPVWTNVGVTVSHDSATETAASSHAIPKATVKQLHGPPDRETQWYPLSEQIRAAGDPRDENRSETKTSQLHNWAPEKRLPSHRGPNFGATTGYQRQETSIVRPPSGLSRLPSKHPWESSDFSPSIGSSGSDTKKLLSIENQGESVLLDKSEQHLLKEKQNVPASAVAPKIDPNFLPLLRVAHLLLEAAEQQAYGSSDAEMQRSSANETEHVSGAGLRESELSRITKQLSFITQLLISGLLLNVLTSRQLQGSSLNSPLLNSTSEELLGPTVTSLDLPTIHVATATPDVASTYPDYYHYKDAMVWNASSGTSTGEANSVPFFLRSWVSRPIPVVPLPEGVTDLVGEHPAPDGHPPPPPPEFPSEELEVEESIGGGLATSWHSTTTQSPQTTSQPPSYWDTTQSQYNYWNPTTTSTPSPYDYWYQTTKTTQNPYNYWYTTTTTTQSPYNYWNTNEATTQSTYNYWNTNKATTQNPYNYWNTDEPTTKSPYSYWDTSTTTTQSPYNYWYTNKETSQHPYNYWGTTTSTTPSSYNYWYTNQHTHNYWDTTNTTTPSPYDYWQTSTTTTRSPYNYWTTSTQDPYNWYTTRATSATPTKSPYEIWYDYWYGNATTTTKSPYADWYNYWYSKSTTTTKSPYDSWNDYWSKIKATTTTSTSQPQSQYNWYYGWPTTTSPANTEAPTTQRPWYDFWSTATTTTRKPPTNGLSHYNGYYGWQAQTTSSSTEPPTTQRPWYDYWSTTARPATTQSHNNWFDSWKVPTTTQRPWNDYWSTTSRPQSGQSQYNWYHNWLGTTPTTSTSQPAADFPTTTRNPWYDYWGTTKRPSAWYNSWGSAGPTTTSTTESPPTQVQTTESPVGQQPADESHSPDTVSSSVEKPTVQPSQGTHYNADGSYVMDVPGHHEEGFYRVPDGGGAPVLVKQGYYTYMDDRGNQHNVSYVADEYGYRTSGS